MAWPARSRLKHLVMTKLPFITEDLMFVITRAMIKSIVAGVQ